MILSIIVAYAKDKNKKYVIGKNNTIPWHAPKDLARFREYTKGHPIVMGRKTYESIGRPLPKRDNIIITRQKDYKVEGAYVFSDVTEALNFAATKNNEVFVIGGEEIYRQTLDKIDRIYVTRINLPDVEGDTFFPNWDPADFKSIGKETCPEDERLEFEILQRINRSGEIAGDVESLQSLAYYYQGGGVGI